MEGGYAPRSRPSRIDLPRLPRAGSRYRRIASRPARTAPKAPGIARPPPRAGDPPPPAIRTAAGCERHHKAPLNYPCIARPAVERCPAWVYGGKVSNLGITPVLTGIGRRPMPPFRERHVSGARLQFDRYHDFEGRERRILRLDRIAPVQICVRPGPESDPLRRLFDAPGRAGVSN